MDHDILTPYELLTVKERSDWIKFLREPVKIQLALRNIVEGYQLCGYAVVGHDPLTIKKGDDKRVHNGFKFVRESPLSLVPEEIMEHESRPYLRAEAAFIPDGVFLP